MSARKLLSAAFGGNGNDYAPVVLRKRSAAKSSGRGYVRSHEAKVEEIADTGKTQTKKFDSAFVQRVVSARIAKKWKQSELNAHLALPKHTIKQFESRRLTFNGPVKSKLSRWLESCARM